MLLNILRKIKQLGAFHKDYTRVITYLYNNKT